VQILQTSKAITQSLQEGSDNAEWRCHLHTLLVRLSLDKLWQSTLGKNTKQVHDCLLSLYNGDKAYHLTNQDYQASITSSPVYLKTRLI